MALPRGVQEQADKAAAIQARISRQPAPNAAVDDDNSPPSNEPVDWEKRYKGMQRSHEKAVSGLREDNEALKAEITDIRGLLEKAKETEAMEPAAQEPTFTDAEIKEYGQDFLNVIVRVAKTIKGNQPNESIAKELAELKGQFGNIVQHQVKTEEDRFYEELEQMVPDWEVINESDAFKTWLKETMPLTNSERQRFLTAAHKRFDAKAVIDFFRTWKSESGMSHMPNTVTANSRMPIVDGGKETFIVTQAEIANFYDELRRGKWKGREDEARQNELKINRAIQTDRVR
jgi:hypothetical protein